MFKKKKNGNDNGNKLENKKSYTKKRISVTVKSPNQKALLKSIKENLVTIVAGPSGSGKVQRLSAIVKFSAEGILRDPIIVKIEKRYG